MDKVTDARGSIVGGGKALHCKVAYGASSPYWLGNPFFFFGIAILPVDSLSGRKAAKERYLGEGAPQYALNVVDMLMGYKASVNVTQR